MKKLLIIGIGCVSIKYLSAALAGCGLAPVVLCGPDAFARAVRELARDVEFHEVEGCDSADGFDALVAYLDACPVLTASIVAITSLFDEKFGLVGRIARRYGWTCPGSAIVRLSDKAAVHVLVGEFAPRTLALTWRECAALSFSPAPAALARLGERLAQLDEPGGRLILKPAIASGGLGVALIDNDARAPEHIGRMIARVSMGGVAADGVDDMDGADGVADGAVNANGMVGAVDMNGTNGINNTNGAGDTVGANDGTWIAHGEVDADGVVNANGMVGAVDMDDTNGAGDEAGMVGAVDADGKASAAGVDGAINASSADGANDAGGTTGATASTWLIQQALDGRLISCEGYVQRRVIRHLGLSVRSRIGLTEVANVFPADRDWPHALADCHACIDALVARSGLDNSYFHCEFIATGTRAYLIDANIGRPGGASILEQIALAHGCAPQDVLRHALLLPLFAHADALAPRYRTLGAPGTPSAYDACDMSAYPFPAMPVTPDARDETPIDMRVLGLGTDAYGACDPMAAQAPASPGITDAYDACNETLGIWYGMPLAATVERVEAPVSEPVRHTQFAIEGTRVQCVGASDYAWVGMMSGPRAAVRAQIGKVRIVTDAGECLPAFVVESGGKPAGQP